MSLMTILIALYGLGCALSQSLMSASAPLAVIAFFVFGVQRFRVKSLRPIDQAALVLSLFWVIFSTLNLSLRAWSEHSSHTLRNIPLMLIPFLGIVAPKVPHPKEIFWALRVVSLALLISVCIGLAQFFVFHHPAQGLFNNPIYYAYNLLPALLFFGEFASINILTGFIWLGIALSLSRMPWFCGSLYLLLRWIPRALSRWGTARTLLTLVFAGVVGIGSVMSIDILREKAIRTFSTQDPSREWRLRAWEHNIHLFLKNPLMGVGPERNAIDPALQPEYSGHWAPNHRYYAHSIYIQSLADNGLIGTLLLLAAWGCLVVAAPQARLLVGTMALAGATENIFNNSKAAHALYFYTFLIVWLKKRQSGEPIT